MRMEAIWRGDTVAANKEEKHGPNWNHNQVRSEDGEQREQNYLSVALVVLFILLLGVASVYS